MAIGLVDPAAGILTPPRAQHPAHSFHFTLILFPYPVFFFISPQKGTTFYKFRLVPTHPLIWFIATHFDVTRMTFGCLRL